ncbi:DNA cytosine methyltransferase [Acinetobacter baumannii]|uniref:DNA cytosine methyltransferase n=1 Tax=Acinetobacter baumannii TaxID=470 RepID=UPI0009F0CE76|nr:DNA cytosine methyltransferase [Acinetobacter baumannii]EMC5392367.1 DNA cytosine methyltransferase [Acinetobacter baumannii]MCF4217526.1 DNA cytosine methyltransferase [Acinetobacter baumannii]OWX16698.1 DNA methyltransferase [Acinetobacter baumannii]OWX33191.1 DNA methyltransferase [Acinetobacter baumannii]TLT61725.1 DNA cytosine methyltransferase [Acinetobacter baumannii]
MNELALFAGAGGGVLASYLLGWRTVCAVERDAYAAQVLAQRQNDGILEAFPIWSDITTFDGKPWQGIVDVISGGFPCQDISSAGKGAGIEGERSGLWSEMARIIGEVRPRYVYVENSPMLVSRGLTRVISDLAQMGYDAHWARFSASNFGAPHIRDRIWIVAYARCQRGEAGASQTLRSKSEIPKWTNTNNMGSNISNTQSFGWEQTRQSEQSSKERFSRRGGEFAHSNCLNEQRLITSDSNQERWQEQSKRSARSSCNELTWWEAEPELGRVADGVAHRVDRLKAIGNGQVSIVAKCAFEFLGGAE